MSMGNRKALGSMLGQGGKREHSMCLLGVCFLLVKVEWLRNVPARFGLFPVLSALLGVTKYLHPLYNYNISVLQLWSLLVGDCQLRGANQRKPQSPEVNPFPKTVLVPHINSKYHRYLHIFRALPKHMFTLISCIHCIVVRSFFGIMLIFQFLCFSVPKECPQEVVNLIRLCMSREPHLRPTAKQIVKVFQVLSNQRAPGVLKMSEALSLTM